MVFSVAFIRLVKAIHRVKATLNNALANDPCPGKIEDSAKGFVVKKYLLPEISVRRVTETDPYLAFAMPMLGIAYGQAKRVPVPDGIKDMPVLAENLRQIIRSGSVDIWRIDDPAPASAAMMVSPIIRGGVQGLRIHDIVVMPEYRSRNLGTALLLYAAMQAEENNLSFVTWQSSELPMANKMFQRAGAIPRQDLLSIRLERNEISNSASNISIGKVTPSTRFCLLRSLISGVKGLGLHIEDVEADSVNCLHQTLISMLNEAPHFHDRDYVDIVLSTTDSLSQELARKLDTPHPPRHGQPVIWELKDNAFEDAAFSGSKISTI